MAVFNYKFNHPWHARDDKKLLTGVTNEKELVPFISSNVYYGYLPVYREDPNAMETNDINECRENHSVESYPNLTCSGKPQEYINNTGAGRNGILQAAQPQRKRNSAEELDDNFKRIRKEDTATDSATEPVTKCPSDFAFQLNHSLEESSKELMEMLLKNIHGCDMYNFYSADDL